jgi:CheY-like chemotaxis protein
VESQPGKGSTFHFTATLALAPEQPTHLLLPRDLRCLKTLVIDDSSSARESFADMLRALFTTPPDTAPSSEEALKKLLDPGAASIPYDLIFVDWHMPGRDGIETARLIKDRIRKTGGTSSLVLMINGYDLQSVRPQAQLAGVDAFLAKPTRPSDIFDTVAALCGRQPEPVSGSHIVVSKEKLDQIRGTRILVVDDNLFNQQVAESLLAQAGMVVEIASNGFQALEMVEGSVYDLVFMDIQMPDLDGLEVTRRIRERHDASALPIVAMTAHALSEDRKKSLAAGMNDHITKPIDPEELLAMLIKWGNPERGTTQQAHVPQVDRQDAGQPDIVFDFAEIDHQSGLARCLGNVEAYLNLLRMFRQEYADYGKQCEELRTSREYAGIRHLAHSIKGPAGSIGARKLQTAANDLEQALWQQEDTIDDRLILSFQQALKAVIHELAPFLHQEESAMTEGPPSVFDSDRDKGKLLLERLRLCLERNDPEAAAILPEFGSVQTWPKIAEEWALLHRHIRNFDFDEALEALSRIEDRLQTGSNLLDEN